MTENYRDSVPRLLQKIAVKVLPRENWPEGAAEIEDELRAEIKADEEAKLAAQRRAQPEPQVLPPLRPIDPEALRAERALLAETEPEDLIKGMMLECREVVRGTAAVISDPAWYAVHDDYFHRLRGAAEIGTKLADSIVRLRSGANAEERLQRIVVERIERAPARAREVERRALPQGEGVGLHAKNE